MRISKVRLGALVCFVSLSYVPAVLAQNAGAAAGGPGAGKGADNAELGDNTEARIHRQHRRIKMGVERGTLSKEQASQFKATLDKLEAQVASQKQSNGGQLKPEQLRDAETQLNENFRLIETSEKAGTHSVQSGNVLGPKWTPGPDGAQNPASLLRQMKQEERRELRQEKQSNEQTLEKQQLDYEKKTLPAMGQERKDILKDKQQEETIRQDTGAN